MPMVIGAFETRDAAAHAVDDLIAAGIAPDEVSVLGRHGEVADVTPENETARDVATGAGIGAAIGGLGSILVGLAALAIPGIGPVIALGPFAGALTTAFAGGLIGGMIGFLKAHGVPEDEASFYAERVKAGAYLVAVSARPGEEAKARSTLVTSGAEGPIRDRAA